MGKKNEPRPLFSNTYRNKLEIDHRPNRRLKTIKFLKENIENICATEWGTTF